MLHRCSLLFAQATQTQTQLRERSPPWKRPQNPTCHQKTENERQESESRGFQPTRWQKEGGGREGEREGGREREGETERDRERQRETERECVCVRFMYIKRCSPKLPDLDRAARQSCETDRRERERVRERECVRESESESEERASEQTRNCSD